MDFYSNFGRNCCHRQSRCLHQSSTTPHVDNRQTDADCTHSREIPPLTQQPPVPPTRGDITHAVSWDRGAVPPQPHHRPRSSVTRPTTAYPEIVPPLPFPALPTQPRAMNTVTSTPHCSRPCTSCGPKPAEFNRRADGRITREVYYDRMRPSTAQNPTRGTKRISRVDAWTRFLAYEACFQVCLERFLDEQSEAQFFMDSNCCVLKKALQLSDLLLKTGSANSSDDYTTTPFIIWEGNAKAEEPGRMLDLGLGGMISNGSLPSPQTHLSRKDTELRRIKHIRFDRLTTWSSTGNHSGRRPKTRQNQSETGHPTSVCIHASDTDSFFYAFLDESGCPVSHAHGYELIIANSTNSWITVDVYINDQCIGTGTVSLDDVDRTGKKDSGSPRRKPISGCFGFFKNAQEKTKEQETSQQRLEDELITQDIHAPQPSPNRSDMDTAQRPLNLDDTPIHQTGFVHQQHTSNQQSLPQCQCGVKDLASAVYTSDTQRTCDVEILDRNSAAIGMSCSLIIEQSVREVPIEAQEALLSATRYPPQDYLLSDRMKPSLGYVRVSGHMAYEYLLGCALRFENCGARKLFVQGPWEWLLHEFARYFGIRRGFVHLTHIKWLLRPEVRSCTSHCLQTLHQKLTLILQEKHAAGLQENELTAVKLVGEQIKDLLAVVFENYYALNDASALGISESTSGPETQDHPPTALAPALALLNQLENVDVNNNPSWLLDRFKAAGKKKYDKLQASMNDGNEMSDLNKFQIYKGMEHLMLGLRRELESDAKIQESRILPDFIDLPSLSAAVFCKLLMERVERILCQIPPREPSHESIDMLVSLGKLQEYLESQGLMKTNEDGGAVLDILGRFRPFISDWLLLTQERLTVLCQQLQSRLATSGQGSGAYSSCAASPVVSEMLLVMDSEMSIFERVVRFWNAFGSQLESVICRVLREVISTISHQSGMTQGSAPSLSAQPQVSPPQSMRISLDRLCGQFAPDETSIYRKSPNSSPTRTPNKQPAWQWTKDQGSYQPHRPGIDYREAMLLNSLRLILGTVPDLEQKLRDWCKSTEGDEKIESEHGLPGIGDQFAQVVKELRTEYSTATVFCCERIVRDITQNPQNMIGNLILQTGHGTHVPVETSMQSLFDTLQFVCEDLEKSVDRRVFVTLTRGLWEHLSEDLYIFVENLQEGHDFQDAWKCRQHAKSVAFALNDWFRGTLTSIVGHDLAEKDLDLTLHASMTQKLLAENSSIVNMAYAVF